jgi:anti-sigma factor RsiW
MSAAVDGELREPKLSEFLEHIRICEACRAEFEAEKATKAILKNRLKRVKAPQSLVDAIKRQTMGNPSISQFSQMASSTEAMFQSKADSKPWQPWHVLLSNWLFIDPYTNRRANSFFAAGLAFTVLAMLIFAGFVRTQSETGLFDTSRTVAYSAAPNLCELVALNFSSKQDKVDVHTSDPQVIENYFAKTAGIQAVVPNVKGFTLSAARLTAFSSLNACEVIFKREPETTVAVYFINEQDMRGRLTIPNDIMEYISADGRNFRTVRSMQGHQIVVWKWGEIIYAATTNDAHLDLAKVITNPNWN